MANNNLFPRGNLGTPPSIYESSRKPTRPPRQGLKTIAAGGILAVLAAGCTSSPSTNEGPLTIRNEQTTSPTSLNPDRPEPTETQTWPPNPNQPFSFSGGKAELSPATCTKWTPDSPQPVLKINDRYFAIVDARNSYPPECDPLKDPGAAVYQEASYNSGYIPQPEGKFVPNGTVVEVMSITLGQKACNPNGASNAWLQARRGEGEDPAFLPSINAGFSLGSDASPSSLPVFSSQQHMSTAAPGC